MGTLLWKMALSSMGAFIYGGYRSKFDSYTAVIKQHGTILAASSFKQNNPDDNMIAIWMQIIKPPNISKYTYYDFDTSRLG
jgi:hypothetical protein